MVQHLKQIPLDSYRPLRDVVVDNLRQAIVSGQFSAGMRLMELQLAEEMGVSRTLGAGSHPEDGTGGPGGDDPPSGCLRGRYFH